MLELPATPPARRFGHPTMLTAGRKNPRVTRQSTCPLPLDDSPEPESPEGGRSNVSGPQKGTSWDPRGDRARAPRWEARVVAERLARSAQRVASLA